MRVLIVEHDDRLRRAMGREVLEYTGVDVLSAGSAAEAIDLLDRVAPDGMLVSICLSATDALDRGGLDVIDHDRVLGRKTPAVVLSKLLDRDAESRARELGVLDFRIKGELRTSELLRILSGIPVPERLVRPASPNPLASLVGSSARMDDLRREIVACARTEMTVTIMGPPGSGKEQVARAVHDLGPTARRGGAPFLRLRCAELDGDMGEATLFGAERRGSASVERLAGYVELAHNGTLYLDDVAELPLRAQIRFLRLLDARHFRPGGSPNDVGFGARIMVGTSKPLPDLVREGQLNESFDLRIRGYPLRVPALVEHAEDIPELVASFVDPSDFDHGAHTWLSTRAWPGNVRQLKHLVLCATRMCEHRPIGVADFEALLRAWNDELPARTRESVAGTVLDTLRDDGTTLAKFQQVLYAEALRRCNGNQSAAARLMGMDRRTLARLLNRDPEDGDGTDPGRSGG